MEKYDNGFYEVKLPWSPLNTHEIGADASGDGTTDTWRIYVWPYMTLGAWFAYEDLTGDGQFDSRSAGVGAKSADRLINLLDISFAYTQSYSISLQKIESVLVQLGDHTDNRNSWYIYVDFNLDGSPDTLHHLVNGNLKSTRVLIESKWWETGDRLSPYMYETPDPAAHEVVFWNGQRWERKDRGQLSEQDSVD